MHCINDQNYLSTREAAERLGVHPGTLRNWRTYGFEHVPFIRVGSSVLYREDEVRRYLAKRK